MRTPMLCWTLALGLVSMRVAASTNSWDLSTADTRITIGVSANRPVVSRLEDTQTHRNWAGQDMSLPLMAKVWQGQRELQTDWRFQNGVLDKSSGTLTLTFTNTMPRLDLRSHWRARPGHGPIEHWITIENLSGERVTVSQQESLALPDLRPGEAASFWWIKRGGSNASTEGGTFTEPLAAGRDLELASNCDDGSSPVPWMAVQIGETRGLYVGWEFSGLGRIHARVNDHADALAVAIGNHEDFKTDVESGETFHVPPAFVGCYTGDIDAGSYCLHRFILEKLRPSVPKDYPDPTLAYNLYLDAGGANAKEADVLRSARFCHTLGFETFMPDAMWFPAVGDWRWDPARFPHGIAPIEEYVHHSGMKLALWCAWTNGGLSDDPNALSVRGPVGHPDWFSGDFAPDWQPGPFYGGQICLGSPEAEAWAIAKTQWLAANYKLDYIKHDIGPIVNHCNKSTHRHRYGVDASYWATTGYYQVQEQLRQAFPKLLLENCSGGGHIKDFGIVQRTHYTVATDTLSNLPDRQSLYDSTFALPPVVLQAYTYERAYGVPGDDPGSFLWRSGMMGAWQIDPTNTRVWTTEERDSARRAVQSYKEWIRPILQDVQVHHILPRPDGVHWDGMFYWNPRLAHGTLYIFRPGAKEDRQTVKLKGLDPQRMYWVWCEDGSLTAGTRAGQELMQAGLRLQLPQPYTSDLIYVQETSQGRPAGLMEPGGFHLKTAEAHSDPFITTTELAWEPSAHARSYRVVIAAESNLRTPLVQAQVMDPSATLQSLPPGRRLYWKVEAISWGGRRGNAGAPGTFTTPALKELPGVTFVSDMSWVKATAGAGNTVHRDTNYSGKTIFIAGKRYPKGVWTHSFNDATPAELVIDIAGKNFAEFAADVGVEDSSGGGSVQFQVFVDGKLRAETPVLRPGKMQPLRIPVTGAQEVTLRVLNGGDGYSSDHAAWGFARFLAVGAKDPLG